MIVTWLIIILTTTSFIVFFWIRSRNKEKITSSALLNFAKENNCTISSYDHWDKILIGIDNQEINKLFFIRTIPDKEHRAAINLSEVMSCRLVKTERTVRYDKEKVNVIDKIELVFSFVDTHKPDVALEFYNTDYNQLTLSGELQLAQKWSGIVKSVLVTNQNWEKEANKARPQAPSTINAPFGHAHV